MALTGKTISQLTKYTSTLTGNELFPLEYNGATYHVSQSQFSSNIYNINGTLTGDRVLSTGAYKLAIKWNAPFSAYNNIPTTNIFQVKSSTDENAISVWSNGSAAIGRNAIPVSGYGLTVDNGNNSGIYAGGIDVLGAVSAIGGSVIIGQYGAKAIFFNDNASTGYVLYNITDGLVVSSGQYAGAKYNTTVQNYDGKGLRVFGPTGNVAIGGSTFTDEGYKLDVSGSARVSGILTLGATSGIGMTIQDNTAIRGTASTNGNIYIDSNASLDNTGTINLRGKVVTTSTVSISSTLTVGSILMPQNGSVRINTASNGALFLDASLDFTGNIYSRTTSFVVEYSGEFPTSYASSLFTINSTTKGFLPPRMTNTQRTNISSPAVGLMVYCTDATEGLYVYKSTGWTFIV